MSIDIYVKEASQDKALGLQTHAPKVYKKYACKESSDIYIGKNLHSLLCNKDFIEARATAFNGEQNVPVSIDIRVTHEGKVLIRDAGNASSQWLETNVSSTNNKDVKKIARKTQEAYLKYYRTQSSLASIPLVNRELTIETLPDHIRSKFDDLKETVQKQNDKLSGQAAYLRKLEDQNKTLKDQHEQLKTAQKQQKKSLEEAQAKEADLKQQLEKAKKNLNNNDKAHGEKVLKLKDNLQKVQDQIQTLEAQAKKNNTQYKKDVKELQGTINKKTEELENQKNQVKKLTSDLHNTRSALEIALQKINLQEYTIENLKDRITGLEKSEQAKEEQIKQLTKDSSKLTRQLNEQKALSSEQNKKLEQTKEKLGTAEKEKKELTTQLKQMREKLKKATEDSEKIKKEQAQTIANLEEKIANLQKELTQADHKNLLLTTELAEANKTLKQEKSNGKKLKKDLQKEQTAHEEAKQKITNLQRQLTRAETATANANQAKGELEKQLHTLQEKLTKLQQDNPQLETIQKELVAIREAIQSQGLKSGESPQKAIERLSEKIKDQEKTLAEQVTQLTKQAQEYKAAMEQQKEALKDASAVLGIGNQITSIKDLSDAIKKTKADMSEQLQHTQGALQKEEEANKSLTTALEKTEKARQEAEEEAKNANTKTEKMEQRKDKHIQALKTEITEYIEKIDMQRAMIQESTKSAKVNLQKEKATESQLKKQATQIEQLQGNIKTLENKLKAAEKGQAASEQIWEEAKTIVSDQDATIANQKVKLEAAQKRLSQANAETRKRTEELEAARSKLLEAQTFYAQESAKQKQTIDGLNHQIQALQQETTTLHQLKERVSGLQLELDMKNLATDQAQSQKNSLEKRLAVEEANSKESEENRLAEKAKHIEALGELRATLVEKNKALDKLRLKIDELQARANDLEKSEQKNHDLQKEINALYAVFSNCLSNVEIKDPENAKHALDTLKSRHAEKLQKNELELTALQAKHQDDLNRVLKTSLRVSLKGAHLSSRYSNPKNEQQASVIHSKIHQHV